MMFFVGGGGGGGVAVIVVVDILLCFIFSLLCFYDIFLTVSNWLVRLSVE